jgi:hypothetical protein
MNEGTAGLVNEPARLMWDQIDNLDAASPSDTVDIEGTCRYLLLLLL